MAEEKRHPGENADGTNHQCESPQRHAQALLGSRAASLNEESHDDWDDEDYCAAASAGRALPPPFGSIDGAAVLDEVDTWYRRFIRVTFDHDYELLALWTVHTHLAEECYTTPRLQLDSPVEGAGKTTVLDHLKRLAHNPIQIATLSSPALLPRMLNNGMRTILLDEAHRTLRPDKPGVGDLVAIINAGHRIGATRPVNIRGNGGSWEVADMPTFAPVAIAGNDPNLANDTRSRMIRVLLMPDLDGSIEDSDWEYLENEAKALQEKIALWSDSARQTVKGLRVEMPAGCVGRSKEKWRPLKRIAVAAAGHWPEIADQLIEIGLREEAAARETGLKQQPPGMVLLADLFAIWPKDIDFMPTTELVDLLVAHNPGYWGDDSPFGKRLTGTRLGLMLNQASNLTSVRPGGKGPRGYTRSALRIAWDRMRIGQTVSDTNPGYSANSVNPERESDQPESGDAGLTDFSGCTGLREANTGFDDAIVHTENPIVGYDVGTSFDALTNELLTRISEPELQTPLASGHAKPPRPDRKPEFVYGFCECGDRSGPALVDKETGLCRTCWESTPIEVGAQ